MSVILGGVEFGINVTLGQSVASINAVSTALTNLAASAAAANSANAAGAQGFQQQQQQQQLVTAAVNHLVTANQHYVAANQQVDATNRAVTRSFGAIAAAIAGIGFSRWISHITLLAARVENLDTVMRNEGQIAHYAAGELSLYEQEIKKLGITTQVTREVMARFAQNHIDLADASKIARIAQDAAVVAGLNSSETTERLAIAIQRLDTRMLRNLGILVNLRQEYEEYGLKTGRVETSLTATEKQQIVLNAVMEAGTRITGTYEKSLSDVYKQFTSLDRKIEESQRSLGESFIPAMEVAIKVVDTMFDTMQQQPKDDWTATAKFLHSIGPLLNVVSAAAAAAGATFVSMAGGLAVGQAIMGSYAAATGIATTSTLAFAGANTAAGRSLIFLFNVLKAHPVILAVSAMAAAIAVVSALKRQTEQAREEQLKTVDADIARETSLRTLIPEIEALSRITNRTASQQLQLNSAVKSAIQLMPEYKQKLFDVNKGEKEFLNTLTELQKRGTIPISDIAAAEGTKAANEEIVRRGLDDGLNTVKTVEQRLAEKRAAIVVEQNRLAEVNRLYAEETKHSDILYLDAALTASRTTAEINANIAKLEVGIKSLQRTDNQTKLRGLEEAVLRAETAAQLANRIHERVGEARVSYLRDSNLQAIDQLHDYLRTLTADFEVEAQIIERRDRRLLEAAAERDDVIAKAKAEKKSPEEQRKIAQAAEENYVKKRLQFQKQFDYETKLSQDTQRAFAESVELTTMKLRDYDIETANLTQRLLLLRSGVESGVIDVMQKLSEESRLARLTMSEFGRQIDEVETRLQEFRKHRDSLVDATGFALPGKESEAQFNAGQIAQTERQLEAIRQAEQATATGRAARRNILFQQLLDARAGSNSDLDSAARKLQSEIAQQELSLRSRGKAPEDADAEMKLLNANVEFKTAELELVRKISAVETHIQELRASEASREELQNADARLEKLRGILNLEQRSLDLKRQQAEVERIQAAGNRASAELDRFYQTEQFIRSKQIELYGEQYRGQAKSTQTASQYAGAIGSAANVNQIGRIVALAKSELGGALNDPLIKNMLKDAVAAKRLEFEQRQLQKDSYSTLRELLRTSIQSLEELRSMNGGAAQPRQVPNGTNGVIEEIRGKRRTLSTPESRGSGGSGVDQIRGMRRTLGYSPTQNIRLGTYDIPESQAAYFMQNPSVFSGGVGSMAIGLSSGKSPKAGSAAGVNSVEGVRSAYESLLATQNAAFQSISSGLNELAAKMRTADVRMDRTLKAQEHSYRAAGLR